MAWKAAVLIPAAGASSRWKGKKKKQFAELNGRAVFMRSIEVFAEREDVIQTILAIPEDEQELFEIRYGSKLTFFGVKYIIGGPERYETIQKMLDEVYDEPDLIAIHDAVRPCVKPEQVDAVFQAAMEHGAACLAAPIVGSVKQVDDEGFVVKSLDRRLFWETQTPQVFKTDLIRKAYENRHQIEDQITDDVQLVEALGHKVKVVESDSENLKITSGADLQVASGIIQARQDAAKPSKGGPSFFEEAQW